MRKLLLSQFIPIFLTVITFLIISLGLILFAKILNLFPTNEKILINIKIPDVLIGLTIYLKTSIDFAIFIGNLIKTNPGWKKRVSVEIGTSLGNALGTIAILTVWFFFKDVELLLALMIFIASLVLLKMAEEGLGDFLEVYKSQKLTRPLLRAKNLLSLINKLFSPILSRIIPSGKINSDKAFPFFRLLVFSLTVPFILGLDDFAGYIPLFSIVNVISFSIGVFLGHMILTASLFISPKKTVQLVETPIIIIFGSGAFILIALYGFMEVLKIIF